MKNERKENEATEKVLLTIDSDSMYENCIVGISLNGAKAINGSLIISVMIIILI